MTFVKRAHKNGWFLQVSAQLFPSTSPATFLVSWALPKDKSSARQPGLFALPGWSWSLVSWSVQFSCSVMSDSLWPMNRSMPGLPVHHYLPEFTQTHVHRVHDAIQPSHPQSSPSPPAPNPSQHQSLFQWVNSSHEVAKVLEFQL